MTRKIFRDKFIADGKCANCGSREPIKRNLYCGLCMLKDREKGRKWYKKNKEKKKKYALNEYYIRMETNRCIGCGTPLHPEADAGRVSCINCREGLYATNY